MFKEHVVCTPDTENLRVAVFSSVAVHIIVQLELLGESAWWRADFSFVCTGRQSPETPDQREFVKKFAHELEEMNLK